MPASFVSILASRRFRLGHALAACGLIVLGCGTPPSAGTDPSSMVLATDVVRELTPSSVLVYEAGFSDTFVGQDLVPMMSAGEGYNEKWEFILTSAPYETRIRFEVSNLGLGDFKGKVSGKVRNRELPADTESYAISGSFSEGKWSYDKSSFSLSMGAWSVQGEPGRFEIRGVAGDRGQVAFDYVVTGSSWRPGSGVSFFADKYAQYMKSQVPIFNGDAQGTVTIADQSHAVRGYAYANHLGSNLAMHEMASSFYHFRKHDDNLYIEWRHVETTQQYHKQAIPFLVIAHRGVVLFEATELELVPESYWTDPGNFGYSIVHGLTLRARNNDDQVELHFAAGEVEASDPLARVSGFERSIALQFAKPMDYSIRGPWRLDLQVEGIQATVRGEGSYSITRLQ